MKNLSLALNAVLLVAVVVLYVLFFAGSKSKPKKSSHSSESASEITAGEIAYINIDTVYAHYNMYEDVVGDLEATLKIAQDQFENKQRTFQKNVEDFQYKVQRGLVTRSEAEQLQGTLQQEEQQLMALQNELQYKLAEEQQVAQRKVLNSIMEYLKNMEGADQYRFILGNTFGGNIMYANENLDITYTVIEGLNASYAEDKK